MLQSSMSRWHVGSNEGHVVSPCGPRLALVKAMSMQVLCGCSGERVNCRLCWRVRSNDHYGPRKLLRLLQTKRLRSSCERPVVRLRL
jgi:hypothetical protein